MFRKEKEIRNLRPPQPQEVEFNLKRTYKQTPPPAPVMDIQAEEPEDDFPINKPEKEDTSVSDESEGVTMVFEPTVSNPVPIVQEDSLEEAEPGFEVEPAGFGRRIPRT